MTLMYPGCLRRGGGCEGTGRCELAPHEVTPFHALVGVSYKGTY